jgi:hypothetical protein
MKPRWWVDDLTTITTVVVCLVALGGQGHHRFGPAENALDYLSGARPRIEVDSPRL